MAHTLEANKAKTDSLLKITRDIRTPMNSIVGLAGLMERCLDDKEKSLDYLKKIRSACESLVTIVDTVQQKADIESGKTVQDVTPFSMSLIAGGKRILMAEDNDLNAEIAATILTDVGFEVVRAVDGLNCVEILSKADAGNFDLILMDVQMPNMDGYEATHKIRSMSDSSFANIPIIAMTASTLDEDKQKALDSGMNDHLSKPIDIPVMMDMLARFLK